MHIRVDQFLFRNSLSHFSGLCSGYVEQLEKSRVIFVKAEI